MEFSHYSVLLNECIEALNIAPDGIYVDGTAGGAGHSREIAKRLTTGRLIAIDKDPDAIAAATERLAPYPCAQVVQGDFADMDRILAELEIPQVNGILQCGRAAGYAHEPERTFRPGHCEHLQCGRADPHPPGIWGGAVCL